MGVVPVEQDAGSRRAGDRRNALADEVDLRTLDGQRVDAANDRTNRASLERGRRHLERGKLFRCHLMSLDDADHRQTERRVDVRRSCAGAKGHVELAIDSGAHTTRPPEPPRPTPAR